MSKHTRGQAPPWASHSAAVMYTMPSGHASERRESSENQDCILDMNTFIEWCAWFKKLKYGWILNKATQIQFCTYLSMALWILNYKETWYSTQAGVGVAVSSLYVRPGAAAALMLWGGWIAESLSCLDTRVTFWWALRPHWPHWPATIYWK